MKIFIFLSIPLILHSIFVHPQDTMLLDEGAREEIVSKVVSIVKEKYVFADVGEKMATYLLTQFEKGEYNTFTEVNPFCNKLTSDLRDISHDKHIFVFDSPEEALLLKAEKGLLPKDEAKKLNEQSYITDKRQNFGFRKVEILDGNIGYLDIRYFTESDTLQETLIGAMKFLSNSDAIMIDLRDNGGGSLTPLLFSYFFSNEKIYLGGCVCRDTTRNENLWTLLNIPGKRLPDVELYILTNSRTFSAAEDFSYTMQNLKRATVVGETTKGGAHPVDCFIVKGDILTQISICESYNPITKTNWEGTGVKPDIDVPEHLAYEKAYMTALERLQNKCTDKSRIQEYEWHKNIAAEKVKNELVLTSELNEYSGKYDDVEFVLKNNYLFWRQSDKEEFILVPLSKDNFIFDDSEDYIVKFKRNENGIVNGYQLLIKSKQDSPVRYKANHDKNNPG